jgi:hypothetical protein
MSCLEAASAAFRCLASAQSAGASSFSSHADMFLTDLAEARRLLRKRISMLGPDVPYENASTRKLIEADIAVEKVAHLHRALEKTLEGTDVTHSMDPMEADVINETALHVEPATIRMDTGNGSRPSPILCAEAESTRMDIND